jgi:hypothetical protein
VIISKSKLKVADDEHQVQTVRHVTPWCPIPPCISHQGIGLHKDHSPLYAQYALPYSMISDYVPDEATLYMRCLVCRRGLRITLGGTEIDDEDLLQDVITSSI